VSGALCILTRRQQNGARDARARGSASGISAGPPILLGQVTVRTRDYTSLGATAPGAITAGTRTVAGTRPPPAGTATRTPVPTSRRLTRYRLGGPAQDTAGRAAKQRQYRDQAHGDESDHDGVFDERLSSLASAEEPDAAT